jgi:hypothetical protein
MERWSINLLTFQFNIIIFTAFKSGLWIRNCNGIFYVLVILYACCLVHVYDPSRLHDYYIDERLTLSNALSRCIQRLVPAHSHSAHKTTVRHLLNSPSFDTSQNHSHIIPHILRGIIHINTPMAPNSTQRSLPLGYRIKSHFPFATIIRSSPKSTH